MKKFDELTLEEQEQAENRCLEDVLRDILEYGMRFDDAKNGNDLQARIDAALAKSDEMQTPWFAGEYLLDDDVVSEALRGMARCDAEDAYYLEDGENAVRLPKEV